MKTTVDKIREISNFFADEIIDPSQMVSADPNTIKNPLISNSSLKQICYDCTCHGSSDNKNMELYDLDDIVYNINSFGYRSEEFSKEDAANNFLYVGCSVTFGVGLPDNLIWPYFLNKKLNGEKVFNLGINGISTNMITYNIHKYIQQFGKPKAVFALYPNFSRTESFLDTKLSIIHFKEHAEIQFGPNLRNTVDMSAFTINQIMPIKILSDYLDSIGVPFFWSSWWKPFNDYLKYEKREMFKNFVQFDISMDVDLVDVYKSHHYFNIARDNQHFGILGQISITESFFDAWKEYNEKRNS